LCVRRGAGPERLGLGAGSDHRGHQVSISLQGFQTAVYNKVTVESGRNTDLRVTLRPGGLTEVITVEGAAPVLESSSNLISNALGNKQLNELPLAGRNAFGLARLVPGAVAPQGTGSTHFNGMPGGTINPTIDGINNSSNGWKSGGTSFFGTVPARLGAIEEVSVETSGQGAESGSGGVNLKFVTRRGTNQYRGSVFEQHRNEFFNANSFSNNAREIAKNRLRRHDFGGNFGGPLVPFGPLRDKLFLFINYEQEYIPETATRTRTVLQSTADAGIFRYQTAAGEIRQANLLDIARAAGFPSSFDPTMQHQLAGHRAAREHGTTEVANNLNTVSRDATVVARSHVRRGTSSPAPDVVRFSARHRPPIPRYTNRTCSSGSRSGRAGCFSLPDMKSASAAARRSRPSTCCLASCARATA
jgi:hypothetical protein